MLCLQAWLAQFTYAGGCTVVENGNTGTAPPYCGGSITINYDVADDCSQTAACSATFTVDTAPVLTITCPVDTTLANCQDQATVDALFASWLAQFTYAGGCTVVENGNTGTAPPYCGGSITINYDVADDCSQTAACSATFTVDTAPVLTITCPVDTTLANCQDQATVDALFASWLAQFTYAGGCTVVENGNTGTAPPYCGGSITINYDVADDCSQTAACSATFTVDTAPVLTITCPVDTTLANCQDQATVDALFASWLAQFTYAGGCTVVENGNTGTAPPYCGGSITINYDVADDCSQTAACSATFTVDTAPVLTITCPVDTTLANCQDQATVDALFASWLAQFTYAGGCTVVENGNTGTAPPYCGGSITINYDVADDCSQTAACSATFTVDTAPVLTITCPVDTTLANWSRPSYR